MAFLYNSWYCAGWSADLGEKPLGIRILNEDLVIYRDASGAVAVLEGRCPHRFAPMSAGSVKGNTIECPYHGLRFDHTGACIFNPHGSGTIPPRARLRAYPAEERNGAIWVWMGDINKADPSKIVDFDFVSDRKNWTGITGYLKVEADYQLVIDNLLDLTHTPYLHPTTLGTPADHVQADGFRFEFSHTTEEGGVQANYTLYQGPTNPLFALFFKESTGDIYSTMRWEPASTLILHVSQTQAGMPRDTGVHLPSAHLLVPETATTCHYFFALSRNVELDDPSKTHDMAKIAGTAFASEDEPMIRNCQEMMRGLDFLSLEPAILETDIAAIQARRYLAKLIRQEQSDRQTERKA